MNRLFHSAAVIGMGWGLLGLALLVGCGSPTRESASSAAHEDAVPASREDAAAATREGEAPAEPNSDVAAAAGRASLSARDGEAASAPEGTAAAETQKAAGNRAAGPPADNAAASTATGAQVVAPTTEVAGSEAASPPKADGTASQDAAAPNNDGGAAKNASAEPAPAAPAASAKRPAAGQRPPADRTPSRPGEAEKITFEDLNLGMQADVVYRPFMLENSRAKELDGKRVSLSGYMSGGVATTRNIKEFILLRNKECKFGPGGQADHLAQVYLKPGQTTDFTSGAVKVEGRLKIEPFEGPDGNTWSIYRLEDAVVR